MIKVTSNLIFSLTNKYYSYVFRVSGEGILEHLHYGLPVSVHESFPPRFFRTKRDASSQYQGIENYSLASTPQEYPCFGTSDYRMPAMHGVNADGNSIFSLVYDSYEILTEKPGIESMPSSRGGDSETLVITLLDQLHKIEVQLYYTIYADYGVLARSTRFRNLGEHAAELTHAYSSAIDFSPGKYELLHLHGTWSREFNEERVELPRGRFTIDSSRGISSAAHSPFVAILESGASEQGGEVFASTVMYSGNYSISVEQSEYEDVRLLIGINPFNFKWRLSPGKEFETPEALHVYSDAGLGEMSHRWHAFIRDKVSPPQFRHRARPTYLNTWEAAYFDVDAEKVLSLAEQACELGIEMLVLDDGWFEGRRDDSSSLGDWRADRERFPDGLHDLAQRITDKGLQFGLWIEPEMVNPNSRLYKEHPDWILQVPDRKPSLGRNQLILDMSRPEVIEYLYSCLDDLLGCGHISYIKWDMNRMMTEVGSVSQPASRQLEIPHRYVLGLYQLLGKITSKYPHVIFENCASGANRFDLGMLYFMAQNWTSDMCDPIGRLEIIHGCSLLYPLDVTAAYIGPSPNHQNGRISSISSRFNAGFLCASRGISLNQDDLESNKPELQRLIRLAKESASHVVGGRFDRLLKNKNEVCWQYTSANGEYIYMVYFHILAAPNLPFLHVRLRGLDPDAFYRLKDSDKEFAADVLLNYGLPLPYVTKNQFSDGVDYMPEGDFSSCLLVLEKIS